MSSFDVRVFAIQRRPGRRVFEVRWRVAGSDKSRSFITRALADSYRAELIRAARRGLEFDPVGLGNTIRGGDLWAGRQAGSGVVLVGESAEGLLRVDWVLGGVDRFGPVGFGLGRGELAEGTVRPGGVVMP